MLMDEEIETVEFTRAEGVVSVTLLRVFIHKRLNILCRSQENLLNVSRRSLFRRAFSRPRFGSLSILSYSGIDTETGRRQGRFVYVIPERPTDVIYPQHPPFVNEVHPLSHH